MRFEVFQGTDAQWYWRIRARNGKVRGGGGEGYTRKASAIRSIAALIVDVRRGRPIEIRVLQ